MGAGDAIPALVAGNAVVQNPDTRTALTAPWAAPAFFSVGLTDIPSRSNTNRNDSQSFMAERHALQLITQRPSPATIYVRHARRL